MAGAYIGPSSLGPSLLALGERGGQLPPHRWHHAYANPLKGIRQWLGHHECPSHALKPPFHAVLQLHNNLTAHIRAHRACLCAIRAAYSPMCARGRGRPHVLQTSNREFIPGGSR